MEHITKDPAYNAVDPNDFPALLEVERYGARNTAFDKIISATHQHFWDPRDTKYIDFSQSFDLERDYLVNPQANMDLRTAIVSMNGARSTLVMTDEAFHHKFGKTWADRTISQLSRAEHEVIEDWAWNVFQVLLFSLCSPNQKASIYEAVGLDPMWCQQAFMAALSDAEIRQELADASTIFRILIKTLLKAGSSPNVPAAIMRPISTGAIAWRRQSHERR